MSLTDIARGRRSVRDRKTTGALMELDRKDRPREHRFIRGTPRRCVSRAGPRNVGASAIVAIVFGRNRSTARAGDPRRMIAILDALHRGKRLCERLAAGAHHGNAQRFESLRGRHIHIGCLLSAGLPLALTSEIHRDPSRFTADMSTLKSALRYFEIHRNASYLATEIAVSKTAPRWGVSSPHRRNSQRCESLRCRHIHIANRALDELRGSAQGSDSRGLDSSRDPASSHQNRCRDRMVAHAHR